MSVPKFLRDDLLLLENIIANISTETTGADSESLSEEMTTICWCRNLEPVPDFTLKVIQFLDMFCVCHGMMLSSDRPAAGRRRP